MCIAYVSLQQTQIFLPISIKNDEIDKERFCTEYISKANMYSPFNIVRIIPRKLK